MRFSCQLATTSERESSHPLCLQNREGHDEQWSPKVVQDFGLRRWGDRNKLVIPATRWSTLRCVTQLTYKQLDQLPGGGKWARGARRALEGVDESATSLASRASAFAGSVQVANAGLE